MILSCPHLVQNIRQQRGVRRGPQILFEFLKQDRQINKQTNNAMASPPVRTPVPPKAASAAAAPPGTGAESAAPAPVAVRPWPRSARPHRPRVPGLAWRSARRRSCPEGGAAPPDKGANQGTPQRGSNPRPPGHGAALPGELPRGGLRLSRAAMAQLGAGKQISGSGNTGKHWEQGIVGIREAPRSWNIGIGETWDH